MPEDNKEYYADLATGVACVILRDPILFEAGARKLFGVSFFDVPAHVRTVMDIALGLWEKPDLKCRPSYEVLRMEFLALAKAERFSVNKIETTELFLDDVFNSDVHQDGRDYLLKSAEEEYKTRAIRIVRNALRTADLFDRDIIREQEQILNTELWKPPSIVDVAADIENRLYIARRVSTGIDFLDNILDGGTIDGELHGYLAPSGGGKTTLALQLVKGSVLAGRGHIHVTVEQAPDGDISMRQACLMTGLPRKAFLTSGSLSDKTLEALEASRCRWSRYSRMIDLSRTRKVSIPGLFDLVDKAALEMGEEVKVITLDWWGRLRDRMQSNKGDKISSAELRTAQREWLDDFRISCSERLIVGHVFHQLSGEASAKGPKHLASAHDAQEDKNFNNLFDFCWVLGKLTKEKVCRMRADKARSTAGAECFLKLHGEYCYFATATGDEVPLELGRRPGMSVDLDVDPDDAYDDL